MIIKKFEDQVERFYNRPAVKTAERELTYGQLNACANQVAHAIVHNSKDIPEAAGDEKQQVALLFEHGVDMIVGTIGILKANKSYVPLDISDPEKRLVYLLEDSESYMILTNNQNLPLAQILSDQARKKPTVLNIESIGDEFPGTAIKRETSEERTAYILYTSGSTGRPKGVYQTHRNMWYYTWNWIERFSITESDRMSLFTAFTHDGAVQDTFAALLSGACLYPFSMKESSGVEELYMLLVKEEITIWHSVPSLYRYFSNTLTEKDMFYNIRWVLLGGEPLREHDLYLFKSYFPNAQLANVYGQTESSVSTICTISQEDTFDDISLGKPLDETEILLVDEDGNIVEAMGIGEIVVSCDYLAPGYWKNKESSDQVFTHDDELGRLYWTGDLGRLTAENTIKMMGRKDFQIKIRGFRVEIGEIESVLLQHNAIKEGVTIAKENENGDNYLCAYIASEKPILPEELREYLSSELPDYMIPRYFIFLEKMPVTTTGKIDRNRLPEPEEVIDSESTYVAPTNETEKKLAAIWQEILSVEKVGINNNFIELGGHSLLVISIISKVHQEFNVELQLNDVFENPTVKELAQLIGAAEETLFSGIESAEEKEYYPASSMQRQLFLLNEIKEVHTAYNLFMVMNVEGLLDKQKVCESFRALIQRHEALRTSLVMKETEVLQKIRDDIDFEMEYLEVATGTGSEEEIKEEEKKVIRRFIRPFDLSKAPLIRVGIIGISETKHILIFDIHHIVADGVSLNVLLTELFQLYDGKKLPPLRLQYRDYCEWLNSGYGSTLLKKQEEYWLAQFAGNVPVLKMPTDFPRPKIQSLEGDYIGTRLENELKQKINNMNSRYGVTLFMALSAALSILLSKYSGQEDILIGVPAAGREHSDFNNVIGVFINVLTMRHFPHGTKVFEEYLKEVRETTLKGFENQVYPFGELVEKVGDTQDLSRNPLYDVELLVHKFDTLELEVDQLQFNRYPMPSYKSQVDIVFTVVEHNEYIFVGLNYCVKLFKRVTIERFLKHFVNTVIETVENPQIKLSAVEIFSEEEKLQLVKDFNDTGVPYSKETTIDELFERQVEKTPDADAVVAYGVGAPLTYRDLNKKANCLAKILREKGVKPDTLVGLLAERSPEMLICLLAILKSGGGYLPIDPVYPERRINFLLKDSNINILLNDRQLPESTGFNGDILNINAEDIYAGDGWNLETVNRRENIAYVIYTSGSTGTPKGVAVDHGNIAAYLNAFYNEFEILSTDTMLQQASASFDVFVEEVYPLLLKGGKIVISPPDVTRDIDLLLQFISENNVNIISCSPQVLNELNKREPLESVRLYISGGDFLRSGYVDNLLKSGDVYNTYGPTETTVCAAYYKLSGDEKPGVPIGRPVANYNIYILDKYGLPVPIGVPGELCIAGDGVSRGYLNSPELTGEKFNILYRTGDMGRWLPDGNIEFLGRVDRQVKVRGYRIELGEIESCLATHQDVKEAIVLAKENETGDHYLAAYIVSDEELMPSALRDHLARLLPGYMIPSYFVRLDAVPLTAHGKTDYDALLNSVTAQMEDDNEYVPPRSAVEKKLVEVWENVLGRNRIGIDDNFFMIGGDSIKAIQIVSRMNHARYHFEIRDLFRNPTISELGPKVGKMERIADQSTVTGDVPLTPIQHWFFEKNFTNRHHFNQTVLLHFKEGFDREAVTAVFTKIQEHHDALRMTYREENGIVFQTNWGLEYPLSLREYDWRDREVTREVKARLEDAANEIQAGIDLEKGPLMKLGLFRLKDGDRLLVAVHHLVVDGISWRILFEDIETLYRQYRLGETLELPLKTDSFKAWSEKLSQYACSGKFMEEKEYWKNVGAEPVPVIEKDFDEGVGVLKESGTVTFTLDKKQTELLLGDVNRAFGTEINDILLTALGLSINRLYGFKHVAFALEGHGREAILKNVDINRTVGWFTSMYPLVLEFPYGGDEERLPRQIKEVKESIRRLPDKGIGYGILRYLTPPEYREDMTFNIPAQISLNYWGQFGGDAAQMSFQVAAESAGNRFNPEGERPYKLSLAGIVTDDVLRMSVSYSMKQYKAETVERIMEQYKAELNRIIDFCAARETRALTPSDLTYSSLSIEALEKLEKQYAVEDIYALTPMQEGMLFHALYEKEAATHFVQLAYTLRGELKSDVMEESLNELFRRHAVLRAAFISEGLEYPIQLIVKDRKVDFSYEDISRKDSIPGDSRLQYVEDIKEKDRMLPFDLSKDVLMRVRIIRTDPDSYEFIWSFHHILMDAWCTEILVAEFFEIYSSTILRRAVQLPPVRPYRAYIEWLDQLDREESKKYWTDYLISYRDAGGMTALKKQGDSSLGYQNADVALVLEEDTTAALNRLAGRSQVTLNTVLQCVWGLILGLYTGKQDVVFGTVVSGRSAEIEGVESIVGLFINTIPVRIDYGEKTTFDELLRRVQQRAIESESHHHYPLAKIQSECAKNQKLVDHILVFENLPIAEQLDGVIKPKEKEPRSDKRLLTISNTQKFEQSNYDFYLSITLRNYLSIRFKYNDFAFERELIEQIARHFNSVIQQVLMDETISIEQLMLALLPEEEIDKLGEVKGTARLERDTEADFNF